MGSSILIRTFVADGERLSLHVGGGITWRSDPAEEWDETVAKARGPLSSIGAVEVDGVRRRRGSSGWTARRCPPTSPTSRCSTAASSWATACSRRSGRAAGASPSSPSTSSGCAARRTCSGSSSRRPSSGCPAGDRRAPRGRGPGRPRRRRLVRITVSRGSGPRAGCSRRDEHSRPTIVIQAWPSVPPPADHLERGLVGRALGPPRPGTRS